jgi:RNA polymerase sigma-70 factor (ECF subfamily)
MNDPMPAALALPDTAPGPAAPARLDQGAALRLLLANRAMLIGYINAITGDPTLTEDVFQEVSIVVMDKHAQVDGAEGFRPWARTIARFQALKAVSRRRNAPLRLTDAVIDRLDAAWQAGDGGPARGDEIAALSHCLGKLTPRAQRLVQLRYHEDLPGARIAELLQRPLNTVYVAISRIHRALAECVRQELARRGTPHAD